MEIPLKTRNKTTIWPSWRRFFKVPWIARRSNQSILKKINPEYSTLEELMLKLQYFGHLMWRANSLEKTLILGETEGQEEKGMTEDEMVEWYPWLNGHEFERALGDGEGRGSPVCCSPWVTKSQTWLSNWKTNEKKKYLLLHIPLKPRRQLCVSSLRYQKTYTALWLIMNTKYPTIFEGILHLKT